MATYHSLWFLCLAARLSLAFLSQKVTDIYQTVMICILASISFGFLYKSLYGSNNEVQIAKVFWHDTRIVHFMFFALACVSSLKRDKTGRNIASILLYCDVLFSISYVTYVKFS